MSIWRRVHLLTDARNRAGSWLACGAMPGVRARRELGASRDPRLVDCPRCKRTHAYDMAIDMAGLLGTCDSDGRAVTPY